MRSLYINFLLPLVLAGHPSPTYLQNVLPGSDAGVLDLLSQNCQLAKPFYRVVVGLFAIGVLVFKNMADPRPRHWKIFGFDVAKQVSLSLIFILLLILLRGNSRHQLGFPVADDDITLY
jgi:hypothetical protein